MAYGQNANMVSTGQSIGGFLGSGPSMGAGASAAPISPMQEARGSLTSSVSVLHERLSEIERRLDVVCRMAAPDAVGNGAKTDTSPSELRAFLQDQSNCVYLAVSRIESLLNRLEL